MKFFALFIISILICSCGSVTGLYKNRFNNINTDKSWLELKSDAQFEYIAFNNSNGFRFTKGEWSIINDTIYLVEFDRKAPNSTEIKELNDNLNIISTADFTGPVPGIWVFFNDLEKGWETDFDGNLNYSKITDSVFNIKIYDSETKNRLLADISPKQNRASYHLTIDFGLVPNKVYHLPKKWIYKSNRIFPIDVGIIPLRKKYYYKKSDKIPDYTGRFQLSYENMKSGFD